MKKRSQRNFLVLSINFIFATNGIALEANDSSSSTSQPLFLTPYIESGDIETGRALSRVGRLPNAPRDVLSYSGYFTVNKEYNSNLFFWFFPALNADPKAPFILWLQGGPGASGLFALFAENGPYVTLSNATLGLREYTWNKDFHVLYVDSPVGTGFSFTDDEKGYATNQDQVTDDLYEFLQQFFRVYYEYGHSDFYITGESYAGKHAPYLGHKLHMVGCPASINLKGFAIGNGYYGIRMFNHYEDYLYQLGIVTDEQAAFVKETYNSMIYYVEKEDYPMASKQFNKYFLLLKEPGEDTTSFLTTFAGYEFFYNHLFNKKPEDYSFYIDYIKSDQARRAIHVGNLTFHDMSIVKHHLKADFFASSAIDETSSLLEDYKVLVYHGQLDLAIPYVLAERMLLDNVTWTHSADYRSSQRKVWRLEGSDYVAGYVRNFGNLFGVLVRNAGHILPHDQPEVALELITNFINDISLA